MRIIAALLFAAIMAFGTELTVDTKHSSVNFTATQLFFVKVGGTFSDFSGTITVEDGKITAINGEIAVISLHTDNARRDDHLLSSDFFDEVRYKSILFKSTKVMDDGVEAKMTIKDITKTLTFKLEKINVDESVVKVKITGVVDRTEFDIDNSFMSAMVYNDIDVEVALTAK